MIIDGKNFFPLSYINAGLAGYFLGKDDHIYSNKSGKLRALAGTSPYGSYQTYYTLGGNSYSKDRILQQAKVNPKYVSEMTTVPVTVPLSTPSKAAVAKEQLVANSGVSTGVAARGTIIGTVENGTLSIAATPRFHTDPSTLKAEMERLANLNPGKQFVALQVVASVVAGGLQWS